MRSRGTARGGPIHNEWGIEYPDQYMGVTFKADSSKEEADLAPPESPPLHAQTYSRETISSMFGGHPHSPGHRTTLQPQPHRLQQHLLQEPIQDGTQGACKTPERCSIWPGVLQRRKKHSHLFRPT
jgi:hypothetical protein